MALALNSNKTNGAKKQKYQNLDECYFQGIEGQLITNVHFVFCVMAIYGFELYQYIEILDNFNTNIIP